jgi:NAD(P)-dependent dehydrogenase (short-subunit alcohol dehydrogenase family)
VSRPPAPSLTAWYGSDCRLSHRDRRVRPGPGRLYGSDPTGPPRGAFPVIAVRPRAVIAPGNIRLDHPDIRDADAVEEAVNDIVERFDRLDGLVNNAGGQFPARAEDITPNGCGLTTKTAASAPLGDPEVR